jgi:ubiquinone/menaquinone biosynthesis C-methylase UbiE
MDRNWTPEELMETVRGFQPACVIIAAAELDIFTLLRHRPSDAADVARRIHGDLRATTVLLDALAALGLLTKQGDRYQTADVAADMLVAGTPHSSLGMTRHLGNCLRNWAQLARVVLTGKPAACAPSVRGADEDLASFIQAMHEVSSPMVEPLIEALGPLNFHHLLDLGGASGTWTIPLLRRHPQARATIFDHPDVIPMAAQRMTEAGLADRVRLVAGDFDADPLPAGADLAWVSAIVHQNSRQQNRDLFTKIYAALEPAGRILIRDMVIDDTRIRPLMGALFAVNMLVATPGGGTFTFDELRDDLAVAGFTNTRYLHRGEAMDCVLRAEKPRGRSGESG